MKNLMRDRRHKRVRAKVHGTKERPRFSVYRSNKYLHLQLVDDEAGKSIVGSRSDKVKGGTPLERAFNAGKEMAQLAKKEGINTVVFDRGGFMYTGQVKSAADGAREGGLIF
jgi:large subunit ribosomal protein L18